MKRVKPSFRIFQKAKPEDMIHDLTFLSIYMCLFKKNGIE